MKTTAVGLRRPVSVMAAIAAVLGALAVLAIVGIAASPAGALLADSPWIGSSTAGVEGGEGFTVTADGSDGLAQIDYSWSESELVYEEFEFSAQAEVTGSQDIDWTFDGIHGAGSGYVELQWYVTDGETEFSGTLVSDEPPGYFSYSGTTTFNLDLYDEYGFRIVATDGAFDSIAYVDGTLTLEGFTVSVVAQDDPVIAGETTTITVEFDPTGGADLSLAAINVELDGASYVPGSGALDIDGDGTFETLREPSFSDAGISWRPDIFVEEEFRVASAGGTVLSFEVAVAPDYLDFFYYNPRVVVSGELYDVGLVGGVGTFDVIPAPESEASVTLAQAVPLAGDKTGIVGHLAGGPLFTGTLSVFHDSECFDGYLGEGAVPLGSFFIDETTDNGELLFALAIDNIDPVTSGFIAARFNSGLESGCIALGPDNDSWTRAQPIALSAGEGSSDGFIDQAGISRWYKFSIQPGATATVDLSDLPANYDLALFKDISQAYTDLANPIEDLNRLSAEFAPSVFSPSVFSPSVFSPSVFSPDAYAPSVFSPSVFSPSVFSPSVFSPSVFSPSVFSPSVFSPSVFSPSVFSPSVFSGADYAPSVFSPSVFSPSVFSPSVFSPEAFASAQMRSIIAVSAKNGTSPELVVANTWTNTGEYYIRVTGRNGAFDVAQKFQVDVSLTDASCNLTGFSYPSDRGVVAGTTVDSVILWDSSAVQGSDAEIASLADRLNTLALRTEIDGVVIDLATDPQVGEVGALRTQAADQTQCVYAKNLVAESVKGIVDSYRNPELRYVVLVGGDDSIPFFRYPDQALLGPEQDYDPPVADDSASQAALRLNFILGQDEYGARISISSGDGSIPIPDLAVGRVVETAAEAIGVIDAYLGTADGVVSSTSSLTTGYDFLTDAAFAVADHLDAGIGEVGDRLIDPADQSPDDPATWTAADLRASLFDSGRHDIVYLAGHFSANSALAADYKTSVITTELAESTVDFTNSIVFSGGCHSGYSIVDGEVVPGVTLPLDWAQAFAQKGATLVAGTGYQYGDTDFVEYSERLYAGLAEQLRVGTGAVAVGEALVSAKQDYLETTPDMRGLHRKALIISTVFGLPMISVDLPQGRIIEPPDDSIVASTTAFGAGPGGVLGLSFADIAIDGTSVPNNVTLKQLPDPLPDPLLPSDFIDRVATYYSGPDGVVTNPAEPAIPLASNNVSVNGQVLRGVGFRGGDYEDMMGVVPLTGAPTTELRGVHTPFASEVLFPMRLATVNYFGELSGEGGLTRLNVTPAQHRVGQVGDLDAMLRLYSDVDLRLYYSANTESYNGAIPALAAPPTITRVSAQVVDADGDGSEDDIIFEVFVAGDPVAGIQEVWVTHTDESAPNPTWDSIDLLQDELESTRWTGELIDGALGSLNFVAQAVNGVGLVAFDDNFGEYFAVGSGETTFPDTTVLALGSVGSGVFGSDLAVSATLTQDDIPVAGATVLFSIGGSTRVGITDSSGAATASLPLTSVPSDYTLAAAYGGDANLGASVAEQSFTIDKAATALIISPASVSVPVGADTGLTATLTGPGGGPLRERTVYFTVTDGVESQTVAAITNFVGAVGLGAVDLPSGDYVVTARFLGEIPFPGGPTTLSDPTYLASSVAGSLTLSGDAGLDTDGDGIPDDVDTDDDNDGVSDAVEITIGTDPLVAQLGRQFIAAIRDYLDGLDGSESEDKRISKAIQALDKALNDKYWEDDDSPDSDDGKKVFSESRKAVKELAKVHSRGESLAGSARTAIDVLLLVDRQLARLAVDEAIAAGQDPHDIAEAEEHLDRGDAYDAAHRWDKAVKEYEKAWDEVN